MAEIQISIVTPERLAYAGEVSEVRVPGWEGEFDVLPGHDVVLSLLRAGMLSLTAGGTETRLVIGRGFVEVTGNRVTVLTDRVEAPDAVSRSAAVNELAETEARMAEVGELGGEWDTLEERREHALAILGLAQG